jgi:phosphoglycolate phosphatase-like HAD superfamily hydrolase
MILLAGDSWAAIDPLPSWNEGANKSAIIGFINDVTKEGGEFYIRPEDRVVTFDEDGTLWVEHPIYTEMLFAFDRVKALAPNHPEWANIEPYKSIIAGDFGAIKGFEAKDIEELIAATHTGMTLNEFHETVNQWLKIAVHPRFKKPFTELVYLPMLEVMQLFKDNQFQVFIASGGGQEFMRSFAERLYGLPPGHIIGTAGQMQYQYQNGNPVLLKVPKLMFIDDKSGKPEGINLMIGKIPVAAFGNSIGDKEMLEWTQLTKGKSLQFLVHHDDAVREYSYGPDTKVGTFSDALMEEAKAKGWHVVSMKNDWKVIFR